MTLSLLILLLAAFVASVLGMVAAGLVWWFEAHAATQGQVGAASTATATVSLTIPERVRLSGVADMSLGQWPGAGGLTGSQTVCVYSNGDGHYRLTQAGQARLFNGTDSLPYQVYFNDAPSPSGGAALVADTPLVGQTGANTQAADCSQGGPSAAVRVEVSATDLRAARPGAYTGVLTLVAEVE